MDCTRTYIPHLDSERELLCPTYQAQMGTFRSKTAEEAGYDIILMNEQKGSEEGGGNKMNDTTTTPTPTTITDGWDDIEPINIDYNNYNAEDDYEPYPFDNNMIDNLSLMDSEIDCFFIFVIAVVIHDIISIG